MKRVLVLLSLAACATASAQEEIDERHGLYLPSLGTRFGELYDHVTPITKSNSLASETHITEIALERGGCYGRCPVYRVAFYSDGSVRYFGEANVEKLGFYTGRISLSQYDKLAEKIRELDVSSLHPVYTRMVTDSATVFLSLVVDGTRTVIVDYANSGPATLLATHYFVDDTLRFVQWDDARSIKDEIVPELIQRFNIESNQVRIEIADTLAGFGMEAAAAVPALLDAVDSSDRKVRSAEVRALGNIGPGAENAIPALLPLLKDADPMVRLGAASALKGIGKDSESIASALLPLLEDENVQTREAAAQALEKQSSSVDRILPALLRSLEDPSPTVSARAIATLLTIAPTNDSFRSYVLGVASKQPPPDSLQYDQYKALLRAIASLGRDALETLPFLIQSLKNQYPDIRAYAADAIGTIGPSASSAADTLLDNCQTTRGNSAASAFNALVKVLSQSEELTLTLTELGKRGDKRAIFALGGIKPTTDEILKTLAEAAHDDDHLMRVAAVDALGEIGPDAQFAIEAVIEVLNGDSSYAAEHALAALVQIAPCAQTTIDVLIDQLRDYSARVRAAAIVALRNCDPQSERIRDVLPYLANDKDENVRHEAFVSRHMAGDFN